jgi:chromosome segregation ATPase
MEIMKDEIKLKDMTDFLENVYKDIKKQPTLEEELEKERKFINKIKGNNEDEVKELLGHIEILDNTDYILHSDKAKALLNYITNLQERNNNLKEDFKRHIDRINELTERNDNLQKENENLKNNYNDNEQAIHKIMEENKHLRTELNCYKLKCEKASDFILSKAKEYKPHFAKVELNTADCNELLNILQGGDE